MPAPEVVETQIVSGGREVWLRWDDAHSEALPAIWLCDNADQAFDPSTGQRRRSPCGLDPGVLLQSAVLTSEALVFRTHPGGEAQIARPRLQARRRVTDAPVRWLTPDVFAALQPISADDFLHRDEALRDTLARLARLGLAMLTGAPASPGVVDSLVARFGFVRETNYGRLFDVRAEATPSHLAYTAEALDLHTDNPYRNPVPTLQVLHAIRSDAHGGGESCFVDGHAQADGMALEDAHGVARLAGEDVDFRYRARDGAVYQARRPIIALGLHGQSQAIHLNHRSMSPLTMHAPKLGDWYGAYLDFHRRVHDPAAQLRLRLRPGDVVLFDNRRILHGRTAFVAQADRGGRWLQGCYADIDGALATLARLSGPGADFPRPVVG